MQRARGQAAGYLARARGLYDLWRRAVEQQAWAVVAVGAARRQLAHAGSTARVRASATNRRVRVEHDPPLWPRWPYGVRWRRHPRRPL